MSTQKTPKKNTLRKTNAGEGIDSASYSYRLSNWVRNSIIPPLRLTIAFAGRWHVKDKKPRMLLRGVGRVGQTHKKGMFDH